MKYSTRYKGNSAEEIALSFLKQKGYKLVKKNFFTKQGEIDLIMQDEDFIVFIEVKSINIDSEYSIFQTVTKRKKRRILKTVRSWLSRKNKQNNIWRYDFVGIVFNGDTYIVEHFENEELE